ncbi:MAG: response regulator [Myxococcales bacterium]|nr:response regulator [Myxococcales bacterium]
MSENSTALSALIVDDDTSVHGVFGRLFTKMGYACDAVSTGEEALTRIQQKAYDVCLVDKQLPGVGGTNVARSIRSQIPDAVIIFITGHATPGSADELVGVADEYLSKPFELDTVRETVSALVAQRKTQRVRQPSPVPAKQPGQKWVYVMSDDAAATRLLGDVCRHLGAHMTHGGALPTEAPDVLVLSGSQASFEVRKAVWGFQAKKRDFKVVLLVNPTSASDAAAAVALKAQYRIPLPATPQMTHLLMQRALA